MTINVWQFIGKPSDFRSREKTVQKVKHWDEVPASRKKKFPMYGQVKKDGVYCIILTKANGDKGFFGRTGLQLTNIGNAPHLATPLSSVVIAELCCDKCSLEQLSGVVNPNRTEPLTDEQQYYADNLYFAVHDLLYPAAFINGSTGCNYMNRWFEARMHMPKETLPVTPLHNEQEVREFAKKCIDADEEGAVIKQDEGWEAGHKGWRMMKIVREVSYDLLCTGWEEGKGKYECKVANLLFRWGGVDNGLKAMLGEGWTHKDAGLLFYSTHLPAYAHLNPVGKLFQVYGLSDSSKGLIRLPKVGALRHDKELPDEN